MATSVRDALYRYGGMYGSAWKDGALCAEIVEVSANLEVARIEVPLVGQTKQGYKPGRESREGSLNIQKIDTKWEKDLWTFLRDRQKYLNDSQNRGGQPPQFPQFDLKLEVADPDAFGVEAWQLFGCGIWQVPLGFNITDDIINREFPFTWEREEPVDAFTLDEDNVKTPWIV